MASILGTTWTIREFTADTPFKQPNTILTITPDARVKFDAWDEQGTYHPGKHKVTVINSQVHWEFVASETRAGTGRFIMFGCSWGTAPSSDPGRQPDPMGSWVADPQGY